MAALACAPVRWLHSLRGSARTLRRRQPNGRPKEPAPDIQSSACVLRGARCGCGCPLRGAWCLLRSTVARCVVRGALGPAASYGCVLRTAWCVLRGACCVMPAAYCVLGTAYRVVRGACCDFGLGLALLSQIGSTCPQQSDRQASAVGDGATYTDMCAGMKLASD